MTRATPLPSPPPLNELIAREPVALFLDFDGTLVELASEPDAICVAANLAAGLASLSARLEGRLALVTGRDLDDIERHLGDCRIARAGSHGASRRSADGETMGEEPRALPEGAALAMREFALSQGLIYEAKRHGGAIHYRAAPQAREEAHAFARSLAEQNVLEVKLGKAVVELVHPGSSKAAAVGTFMAAAPFAGAMPVFVGDDLTDEDGFSAASAAGGFGIAVGERTSTAARFWLRDVAAVHEWLGL